MARVLVVEDDQQVRMMLRMTLERAGYEIDEAQTAGWRCRSMRLIPPI